MSTWKLSGGLLLCFVSILVLSCVSTEAENLTDDDDDNDDATSCTSDLDCNTAVELCNFELGQCQERSQCNEGDFSCPTGQVCDLASNLCMRETGGTTGCTGDADCEPGTVCNLGTGTCVPDGTDDDDDDLPTDDDDDNDDNGGDDDDDNTTDDDDDVTDDDDDNTTDDDDDATDDDDNTTDDDDDVTDDDDDDTSDGDVSDGDISDGDVTDGDVETGTAGYCESCSSTEDCAPGGVCMMDGSGTKFCGTDCSTSGCAYEGSYCKTLTGGGQQCWPTDNLCGAAADCTTTGCPDGQTCNTGTGQCENTGTTSCTSDDDCAQTQYCTASNVCTNISTGDACDITVDSYVGCCDSNVMVWCESGIRQEINCSNLVDGTATCGWYSTGEYYSCMGSSTGADPGGFPMACNGGLPADACPGVTPTVIGSLPYTDTSTTTGATSLFSKECAEDTDYTLNGAEKVYSIHLDTEKDLTIVATPNTTWDISVTIRQYCDYTFMCVGIDNAFSGSAETLLVHVPAGDFFIVVDSYSSSQSGSYTLSVTESASR